MKKEKWLLQEIDLWQQSSIINIETAAVLKERYTPKKNINYLILLFSIIGALLIGTGIILISAKNWYTFPIFIRVSLAFLPLALSQALAVYVMKFKYENVAWRESVAILMTASVFTVIAIIGQIFHLPNDYGVYILTCGMLSLPVIYVYIQLNSRININAQGKYGIISVDSDGFANIAKVTNKKPEYSAYVKGNKNSWQFKLPIDRYSMDEKLAPKAELYMQKNISDKEAYVTVRIKNGNLVISGLYIDGVTIEDVVNINLQ